MLSCEAAEVFQALAHFVSEGRPSEPLVGQCPADARGPGQQTGGALLTGHDPDTFESVGGAVEITTQEPGRAARSAPRLVRAHLKAAVGALLSHPAVTGRKAVERFGREIDSDSFPKDDQRLNAHLRHSYMNRGTKALKENLIKVVCKDTLKPDAVG
ncbi:hypothetical protein [Streptomyces sp. NPDC088350]|uniref:hypothetical protein n=1 Tax=Streptomyces sp. NPDC088350 TaxID=3365854 RepID=UPI00382FB912